MSRATEGGITVVGISAYYHDSAVCLLRDGEIVAAAQEERFSRRKNDARFPGEALRYCLEVGGLAIEEVDYVAYYEQPRLKLERIVETWLARAPRGFGNFHRALPGCFSKRLRIESLLTKELGGRPRQPYVFPEHHQSHAASAFYPSPYESACILTLDGVGEWTTTSIGRGKGRSIEVLAELRFPHSLGLLYAAFTAYLGFRVNSGEYKVMGLAPLGKPVFRDWILSQVVDLKEDGSFQLNLDYFSFLDSQVMTSPRFAAELGFSSREPESEIRSCDKDLAASIQSVTEEIILRIAKEAHALTGEKNLVIAGGVGMNCVANGRLLRESPFKSIWVQPAANDAGGALGAALFSWHECLKKERPEPRQDGQRASLLGPNFSEPEILETLDHFGLVYDCLKEEGELAERIAGLIAEGKTVGHFSGRMEFGPRALGARSILGDPRDAELQARLNSKVKNRESFRPFAPVVLAECAADFFDLPGGRESPYMSFVAPVKKGDLIPAVTHVDGTARLQTVAQERQPRLHAILKAFQRITGIPILVNTSFNVRGEPIVCSPEEALRCFATTDLDVIVLGRFLVLKGQQNLKLLQEEERPETQRAASTMGGFLRLVYLVVAGLLFYLILCPLAWLSKLTGRDPLLLKPRPQQNSHWRMRRS